MFHECGVRVYFRVFLHFQHGAVLKVQVSALDCVLISKKKKKKPPNCGSVDLKSVTSSVSHSTAVDGRDKASLCGGGKTNNSTPRNGKDQERMKSGNCLELKKEFPNNSGTSSGICSPAAGSERLLTLNTG